MLFAPIRGDNNVSHPTLLSDANTTSNTTTGWRIGEQASKDGTCSFVRLGAAVSRVEWQNSIMGKKPAILEVPDTNSSWAQVCDIVPWRSLTLVTAGIST